MKAKILLVEDNVMNQRLAEFVLERDGFEVIATASAEEAIRIAGKILPDIILMDMQLPGMDGLEATGQLKQNPLTSAIPVVALTAHAMIGDEERFISSGCEGYIAKPIQTRELAGMVEKFLNQ
ncbi:MAG: response regulator [Thermoleophilia bacterium]